MVICWADFWRAEMPSGLDDWADKRKLDRGTDVPDVAVFELVSMTSFGLPMRKIARFRAWSKGSNVQRIAEMLLAEKPSNVSLIPTAPPGQRFALISVTEAAEQAFMEEHEVGRGSELVSHPNTDCWTLGRVLFAKRPIIIAFSNWIHGHAELLQRRYNLQRGMGYQCWIELPVPS